MVRLTLASHITIVRIVLIPLLVMALLYGHHVWALIIFISAAVSDAIDGVIARKMKQTTYVGAILDALADKALVITTVLLLTGVPEPLIGLPLWLVALIIWRDVQIMLGILILHITQSRIPWKSLWSSKVHTTVLLVTIAATLWVNALRAESVSALWLIPLQRGLVWGTLATTAISWYQYTVWGFSLLYEDRNGSSSGGH